MSNRPSSDGEPTTSSGSSERPPTDPGTLEYHFPNYARPIRLASFWLAIVLPFVYVPILLAGLSNATRSSVFLFLLGLNLLALYLGHAYRRH